MGDLASLVERIRKKQNVAAFQRAFEQVRSLREDRTAVEGMRWVQPVDTPDRKTWQTPVDFAADFPEGVAPLSFLHLDVIVPTAQLLAADDYEQHADLQGFAHAMPVLTRVGEVPSLDYAVESVITSSFQTVTYRPGLDVVSFLPFSRADAPKEEQFKPEFFFQLQVDPKFLGDQNNYFAAVVKYGGKVVRQFINDTRIWLPVYADPYHEQLFTADMLVNLSHKELVSTPPNAGTVHIYVYRLNHKPMPRIDYNALIDSLSMKPTLTFGRAGHDDVSRSPLSIVPKSSAPTYQPPESLQQRPLEAGDVRVTGGSRGEKVKTNTVALYFDNNFPVQRISARMIGVREGAVEEARQVLYNLK